MADNYLQFSFAFKIPAERVQQCRAVLDNELERNDAMGESPLLDGWRDYGTVTIEDDGTVFAYSDCNANPLDTAELCAMLLKAADVTTKVGFSYAYSCSKPRLNEFGGGAVVFDRTGCVDETGTAEIVARMLAGEVL